MPRTGLETRIRTLETQVTELATRADLAAQVLRLETEMRSGFSALRGADARLAEGLDKLGAEHARLEVAVAESYGMLREMDARLESLDTRMAGVEGRLETLDTRVDGIDGRLGRVETGMDELRRVMLVLHADMLERFKKLGA